MEKLAASAHVTLQLLLLLPRGSHDNPCDRATYSSLVLLEHDSICIRSSEE